MNSSSAPAGSVKNPALHETIARRAYELWEQEGRAGGNHERHWQEAERQLLGSPTSEGRPTYPPREAGHPVKRPG